MPDANPAGPVTSSYLSGGGLAVSANGSAAGTCLGAFGVEQRDAQRLGTLRVQRGQHLPTTVGQQRQPNDGAWAVAKFVIATVADGKVYVPTASNQLRVYGLCSPSTPCYPGGSSVKNLQAHKR